MRHHLILGGCGFIGRHVAVLLAQAGDMVTLADRVPPSFAIPEHLRERVGWQRFEFASADWEKLVAGVDVVHLYAWTSIPATANANPAGDLIVNVGATLGLLEALRRQPDTRLVFTSSGGTVYGKLHQVPVAESHAFGPVTAYGAGKAAAEIYLKLYSELHGVDCRVARISNPFGAGQDFSRGQGAATTFLHKALTHEPIHIWGDGEVIRDYVHIADVARAMVLLAGAKLAGRHTAFNIGSGAGTSLNGVVEAIELHLGRPVAVVREPPRSFDLPVSVLDITRAGTELGWRPALSFRDGMARTIGDLAAGATLSDLR